LLSRTFTSPTAHALAELPLAVSKSMAVKSRGTIQIIADEYAGLKLDIKRGGGVISAWGLAAVNFTDTGA
jgi:hypothetical protein